MILVGQAKKLLKEQTGDRHVVVITDSNIYGIYSSLIDSYEHIVIAPGEENKTLRTVEIIHRQLLALHADRSTMIVGVGGGIVTDVTGFVASTYMRGVDFGFVATTLLAQVDAAIGGKNGVNLDGYKNIVGTFTLPQFVIADPEFLKTLPADQMQAAMGEVIKYGLMADPEMLEISDITELVRRSMAIKQRIVESDFREGGERKLLNLGHTYAHAIEKATAGLYNHGQAVAIGLTIAAKMSVDLGFLTQPEYEKIVGYITRAGLPTSCPQVPIERLTELVASDKKCRNGKLDMILLRAIGQPFIHTITL
ncbi:MAG: 3-dehydroquinate synthase [Mucinivorans sp.]